MKTTSRRARRMARHHARKKAPGINLVSLMDIFTILVFFLLVSSSNVQQLPNSKDLVLPTSSVDNAPQETVVITVTPLAILVQGRKVADVEQVLADPNFVIANLEDELNFQAKKARLPADSSQGHAVTIMGDQDTPYDLLSKILTTCRKANFTRIAFAAVQKAKVKS